MRFLRLFAGLFVIVHGAEPVLPAPPQPDVLFLVDPGSNKLLPLEQDLPVLRRAGTMAAADFKGPASSIRLTSSRPTFTIRRSAAPEKSRDRLIWLDSVNGKRTMLMSRGPDGITGVPLPGKDFEMEYRQAGAGVYVLRPVAPLPPGEYCINFGRSKTTFLFGVDAGATAPEEPASEPSAAGGTGAASGDKRRTLDSLLQKGLITEADHRAKLAELEGPPAAPGPEERLRRLDGLLKKGLISQPEYQKKRADILAEI